MNKFTIRIFRDEREGPNADGSYKYAFETANGINVEEEGYPTNPGTDEEAHVSKKIDIPSKASNVFGSFNENINNHVK